MLAGQMDSLIALIKSLTSIEQVTLTMDFLQKLPESDRGRSWQACLDAMKRVRGEKE